MKTESFIPDLLREYRLKAKLTGDQVVEKLRARGIEISPKTLYGYETGVSSPKVNTFLCLCDIYEIKSIMDSFGYKYSIASGDSAWEPSQYNDFFNASLLDKVYLLIRWGVPSFEGYENKLKACFPDDSAKANFNRLYDLFITLNEAQQGQAFYYLEQIRNDKNPHFTPDELLLVEYFRKILPDNQPSVLNMVKNAVTDSFTPPPAPAYIRHYLTPAAAGYASPVQGEDYELLERTAGVPAGADFCITVSGDSMEPYIKDGSLVYVQREGDVEEFQPGVFFVDGDVYVKQWCVDMIGTLYLLSANPLREDANITITRDSGRNVVCFGKVLLPKKLPQPVYK